MRSEPQTIEVVSIDPSYVTVFRAAAAERHIDLSVYTLQYDETEKTYIISATYKHKPPRTKGSVSSHKDCSGEIDKATKKLLRFWFAR